MAGYELNSSYSLKTLNLSKNTGPGAAVGVESVSTPSTVSLIGAFQDLVIYHNIDETVTSGFVTIKEQGNLIKQFPIIGWERIDIEFSVMGTSSGGNTSNVSTPYKRSFFVYAIDDMGETGDTKIYSLRFADLSALINVGSRLEHRYTGKAETIIQEICSSEIFTNHGVKNTTSGSAPAINLTVGTSTKFQMDYVSPCWKPFDFITRIAGLAVSTNGTFNDCVFFQQTDGTFQFTDWLTLFNGTPVEFKKKPITTTEIKDKYVINDYVMNNLFNTQSQTMSGMFGDITKIFDFSNMSIHSFVNYYYMADVESDKSKYSAIKVDKINQTSQPGYQVSNPGYIDTMMMPYVKNQKGDPRFSAIKQNPAACINVFATGFDQTSVQRATGGGSVGQPVAYETAKHAYANGIPCNLNMRTKSAIFTLNPCTDLKLGQLVTINMAGNYSEKTDKPTIEEFLNGTWYIGKIKYHLTLSEIEVDVECYSTSLNLRS